MNYAILDIETTGGSPKNEKITEIAIYIHDGEKIINEFVSLVNPEKNIPYFITGLTGINNEMVADSPKFFEIAKDIVKHGLNPLELFALIPEGANSFFSGEIPLG